MGVVSLDEIRVIAVHRPNDVSDGRFKRRVQASGEGARFLHQYEYLITKTRVEVRKHRFHWAYAGHFAALSALQNRTLTNRNYNTFRHGVSVFAKLFADFFAKKSMLPALLLGP